MTLRATALLALTLGATLAAAPPAPAQELLGLGRADSAAEEPERTIAQTSSPAEDRALGKRLAEIYAQVEGLAGVAIEVQAGVVRLSGEAFSSAAREKAVRIANQLQGVVEVQDEITESRDLERRLRPVAADLRERLFDLAAGLPLLAVSLAIFVLFFLAGRLATRWEAPYRRVARNPFARDLARQAVRAAFLLLGAVVALEVLDATALVAAIAGVAGLAGLAVSFAFRDLAENYIASVLLSLRQPFLNDEQVVIEGREGRVVRLTSRATILMDLDGNHVRIPNATVFKATIVNYTRNPERRFWLEVGVANEADLSQALALGVETVAAIPGVLAEPTPRGWVESLGDWSVVLRFSAWIDQRQSDWLKARGEAMRLVKEAFDRAGIVMPEPILTVRGPAAPEAARAEASAAAARAQAAPEPSESDISAETEIAAALEADRAGGGPDLLDESAPQE